MVKISRFYDVHCHAFNLSHPNFIAFINRLNLPPIPIPINLSSVVEETRNILSVMENDIGSFFLIMEYFLKNKDPRFPKKEGEFSKYKKIVLTPLMMDFGCKTAISHQDDYFYNKAPQKPIEQQVIDVFNGIYKYAHGEMQEQADGTLKYLEYHDGGNKRDEKLFEIYPFLGINTENYDDSELKAMLKRYFMEADRHGKNYRHCREDFYNNMGEFTGDIKSVKSNYFAGIKVYPPLGFDPWPEKDEDKLHKVRYLYEFCKNNQIPITAHCQINSFQTVDDATRAIYTTPEKWDQVLSAFPDLKINLAHFGGDEQVGDNATISQAWKDKIVDLTHHYKNVYTDISAVARTAGFYDRLCALLSIDGNSLLKDKILFGSDFPINLMSIGSYNEYLEIFTNYVSLITRYKDLFCNFNPEKFLWDNK